MKILNSTEYDIPEIFRLYDLATAYQREKFPENEWPQFDPEFIAQEVKENRQFKIEIEDKIACI